VQKVLTKLFKTLILKVAFVIIRRLQKPHYSQKQKIKQKQKTTKGLRFDCDIIKSSQGHKYN
jgi:hypothetical protein